ncbi:MAG: prepilin-type N-terminal cleavage/methylation domain-containing protein [Desulfobacteraceae bacterium]|nr:prepilin-type N-terminal cleavage/methylation domain-containing protein [Desulfobacteraceae bacterium]
MKNKRNYQGFTFLEVMVALSVLALILTAVFRLYSQSVSMLISSSFDMKAPFLAQKIVTEYKTDKTARFQNNGKFEDEFEKFSWKIDTEELIVSGYSDELPEEIENIKINKITVTITDNHKNYQTFFYEKTDS